MTGRSITIYLNSDPLCLGAEADEEAVLDYISSIVNLLRREFDIGEVVVHAQDGGWRWRCLDAQIDARIREIEDEVAS